MKAPVDLTHLRRTAARMRRGVRPAPSPTAGVQDVIAEARRNPGQLAVTTARRIGPSRGAAAGAAVAAIALLLGRGRLAGAVRALLARKRSPE